MMVVIDNYDSFTFNLYQILAEFQPNIRVIRNDKMTVNEILQLQPTGIVLSPGPGRPENAGICVELIRAVDATIPILGVCLGHQAIVTAFGARIIRAPEIMHGKEDLIFHYRKGVYQHLPLPFQAGRYHSLIADRGTLPDTLLIEAETADGIIMGVRHATLPIYGVQFHPESILTPAGRQLLQQFMLQCEEDGDVKTQH